MFLKPNGKEIIIETQDGKSKLIDTMSIYYSKRITDRYDDRLDFYHGGNIYCYLKGTY